jgi:hypothetical protein
LVSITKDKEIKDYFSKLGVNGLSRPTTPIPTDPKRNSEFREADFPKQSKPFGLPAISELLRVLVSLIDPSDRTHTDTLHRPLALLLITRGLEIGGKSLSKWISFADGLDSLETPIQRFGVSEDPMRITPEQAIKSSIISIGPAGEIHHQDGSPALVDVQSPSLGAISIDANGNQSILDVSLENVLEDQLTDDVNNNTLISDVNATTGEKTECLPDVINPEMVSLLNGKIQDSNSEQTILFPTPDEVESKPVPESAGDPSSTSVDIVKIARSIKRMIIEKLCRYLFQVNYLG